MDKLKPYPFCGGSAKIVLYIYDTEEQAAEAWNRRVNDV